MTIAFARVPTKPTTWQLSDPCGDCSGCNAKALATRAVQVVEEQLLQSAKDLNPRQMRSDLYYARLDEIHRRRCSMQELEVDQRHMGCERLEILAR